MALHDFHCHLDLMADPKAEYETRGAYRVTTVAVTTTPRAWQQNLAWSKGNPWTRPALGLHPELVGQAQDEVGLMLDLMPQARLIGEIGLDGSPHLADAFEAQRRVFREVLHRAGSLGGRVLSTHSRRAAGQVLDEIRACPSRGGFLPVLHWFSGTASELGRAIAAGCWFSVNGSMLKGARASSLMAAVPLDALLIESDAPFRGGKGDLRATVNRLAEMLGKDTADLEAITDGNASRLLGNFDIPA